MYVAQEAQPQVNPDSTIAQFGMDRAVWHEPEQFVDCHDYPSRGYHVISCVYLHSAFTFRKPCLDSLFVRAVCAGAIYRTEVCTEVCADRRLSISEEALGAFGKSQTYRGRGYDRGQEAEQKQVKIMEDRRDKVQAEYHVLELQPEGPLSESIFEACSLQGIRLRIVIWILVHRSMLPIAKKDVRRFSYVRKVRLADDKTLDVADIGDVVLKTSFGRLPRRLRRPAVKVTKGSLVVARGNKCGSLIGMNMLASKGNIPDAGKVDIYFCKPGGLRKQKKLSFIMSVKTRKLQRLEQVHKEGYGPTFIASI
ncbi:hypothetical protein Tco_1437622 [Tanacetum coccineum]